MKRGSEGLTLIEVLVALFLIAIGLLAAAPMFVHAMQGNATGGDFGSVGAMALDRLELLRATSYSGLVVGGSLTANVAGYFDNSDPAFVVRWEILNNTTPPGTKIINVRAIARRVGPGPRREVTITSLRGR
jgi:prepilin-type N-terminal cleavage/methylation domain-containing protein